MADSILCQYLELIFNLELPNRKIARLVKELGSLSGVYGASAEELKRLGHHPKDSALLKRSFDSDSISYKTRKTLDWISSHKDNHVLCLEDPKYPPLLKQINDPPLLLFVKGNHNLLCRQAIAIVGSRNASRRGEQTAQWLALELTRQELVVCSGLATGIDSAAHRGALLANGVTLAIMGTGVDRVYPASNKSLSGEITASGCLVSEFPLSTPPRAANFPQRNRIISGICLGTIVVEAALKSGSLITARHALDQNREVFAVPDSIHNPLATGSHKLIQQGAKLVDSIAAIVEELEAYMPSPSKLNCCGSANQQSNPEISYSHHDEKLLLNALGQDLCTSDDLSLRTGLSVSRTSQLLSSLELRGIIDMQMGRFRLRQHNLQEIVD